jgi:nucleoside-diphosphate-sugar epimerase
MATLVGSTGFVGTHLARSHDFTIQVHRPDVQTLVGLRTDLLVCSGLPAEKWRANQESDADWANMSGLAQVLATVRADSAVLISTIDVYQPAVGVDEDDPAHLDGSGAYGAHRAWFEAFFRSRFPNALIIRLPGLFAPDVRKNLVHDLIHGRADQLERVNPESTFQFFDVTRTWSVIERAWAAGITLLNVTSEPVTTQAVADLFGVRLSADTDAAQYDMRSVHADTFGGKDGYLYNAATVLEGIGALRSASR